MKKSSKYRLISLKTPFEEDLQKCDIPFCEYPRPQFKRDSYICLNGRWDFEIKGRNDTRYKGEITVPFPPESRISGVEKEIQKDDILIYSRTFSLPDGFINDRVILHFGAVDQYAVVFVNGKIVGKNTGGYLPFSFDITDYLTDGENTLTVNATDPLDKDLPYGKQTNKRGGMWYTKVSGIWQTVWLESVPENYIKEIKISPSLNTLNIYVSGGETEKLLTITTPNGIIEHRFTGDSLYLPIENPVNWSPENPYLYNYTIQSGQDTVESYFALRTVTTEKIGNRSYICLNGKPYFFHGLLDQGYFSDGIFLPATEKGFENDILQMKSCGFNMLRKHIKLEPDLFYYYCDKHGMVVFQDMINSGKYSFLIDTALPTVLPKIKFSHHASERRRDEFIKTGSGIINQLYNHPSVCYYTIFNEGWGQFDADGCYNYFKLLDNSRIYDTTSGWFKQKLSDVESKHIYFRPVKLKAVSTRPMVLSEFGGYSCKIAEHSFNLNKTFGYRLYNNVKDYEKGLIKLYTNEIIPMIEKGLCATVLTQVSDVEDETNGLLTYDRKVLKVNKEKLCELAEKLTEAFNKSVEI